MWNITASGHMSWSTVPGTDYATLAKDSKIENYEAALVLAAGLKSHFDAEVQARNHKFYKVQGEARDKNPQMQKMDELYDQLCKLDMVDHQPKKQAGSNQLLKS